MSLPVIRSGSFPDTEYVADYRFERLGDLFVERVVWRDDAPARRMGKAVIGGAGHLWFRFWLLAHDQVVERYFAPDGSSLGTMIDVCTPLVCQPDACSATDLLLDLWIDPSGQVTLFNEVMYDEAVRSGGVSTEQAALAEQHVRELTAAIARGRFPPPIIRNWQVESARVKPDGGQARDGAERPPVRGRR
jgi:predicted RNA-binding protein associated with RNAse of E/G family